MIENIDKKLPFFEYGLLKPGQPAFSIIKKDVENISNNFIIQGEIWEVNNFPVLDYKGFKEIGGTLLFLKNEYAYKKILNIMPESIYDVKVMTVKNNADNSLQKANVFISSCEESKGFPYNSNIWDIKKQPIFFEGLSLVKDIIDENARLTFDLKNLFLLRLGYLQLFEIIEKFICLTYIYLNASFENISIIANEEIFKKQLKKNIYEKRILKFNNENNIILDSDNPLESLRYYYNLKTYNISKNDININDFNHYKLSLRELYNIFVHLKFFILQNAIFKERESEKCFSIEENFMTDKNEKIEQYADYIKNKFLEFKDNPINFEQNQIDWQHIASHFINKMNK